MAIITRRSSSTNKTITFNGYTGDLVPEISDGLGKAPIPNPLSAARYTLAATYVGNYALFGGGWDNDTSGDSSDYSKAVDAYDTSLNRTTPTPLSIARHSPAATHIGDYALFGGGCDLSTTGDGSFESTIVDAYDTSLNRTTPTPLSAAREAPAATHIGGYALFGGGRDNDTTGDGSGLSAVVDAYDTSLNRTTPTPLSVAIEHLAATHIGNYALFGGGRDFDKSGDGSDYSAVVDAYDTSLNRATRTPLSAVRYGLAATHVGDYALFGGGYSDSRSAVVDAYDTSLNRTTRTPLSVARTGLAATHIGDYALFGGGYSGSGYSAVVDAYDTSLNRTAPTPLSVGRSALAATHIGDYALFGGGQDGDTSGDGSNYSAVVDAYTTKVYKATITLPPNVSYEFDGVSGTTTEPTDVLVGYPVYGSVTV